MDKDRVGKAIKLLSNAVFDGEQFSRQGKHPVKRQVTGKNGKTYTQTFWVKDKTPQSTVQGLNTEGVKDFGELLKANPRKPPLKEATKKEKIDLVVSSTGVSKQKAKRIMLSIEEFAASGGQQIRQAEKEGGGYYVTDEKDDDIDVIEEINTFFDRSPKYQGTIFRGVIVEKDELEKFQEEAKSGFVSNAMSSYSSNLSVSAGFALKARVNQVPVIYSIGDNKTGVDIRGLSTMPEEEEVLQPAGAMLKVTRIDKLSYSDPGYDKSRDVYIFHLEEVEPNLQQKRRNQMREEQQ